MLVPTKDDVKTITDMREDASGLLKRAEKTDKPTIIFHRNTPKAVLLSVKRYNQLMSVLEDAIDAEIAKELEKEEIKEEDYIPSEKVLRDLKIKI